MTSEHRFYRSVSHLGTPARERALEQDLETLFPETLHRFNIKVSGASNTTEVSLHLRNGDISVFGEVPSEGDLRAAILKTVADLAEDFDGKI